MRAVLFIIAANQSWECQGILMIKFPESPDCHSLSFWCCFYNSVRHAGIFYRALQTAIFRPWVKRHTRDSSSTSRVQFTFLSVLLYVNKFGKMIALLFKVSNKSRTAFVSFCRQHQRLWRHCSCKARFMEDMTIYNQQAFKYVIERFFNDKINQIQITIIRILKFVCEICRHNFHVNRQNLPVCQKQLKALQKNLPIEQCVQCTAYLRLKQLVSIRYTRSRQNAWIFTGHSAWQRAAICHVTVGCSSKLFYRKLCVHNTYCSPAKTTYIEDDLAGARGAAALVCLGG
jgi:hypothetical protein